MFWGWMIDPGKKSLTSQNLTTTSNATKQTPVKPFLSVQGELLTSEQEVDGHDCRLLLQRGFALEEVHALRKLQEWYQHGGSDRALVLYHLEFLRRLVANGLLER